MEKCRDARKLKAQSQKFQKSNHDLPTNKPKTSREIKIFSKPSEQKMARKVSYKKNNSSNSSTLKKMNSMEDSFSNSIKNAVPNVQKAPSNNISRLWKSNEKIVEPNSLHFILRIAEDIIRNKIYNDDEILTVISNHVEVNKNVLQKELMQKLINDFLTNLNLVYLQEKVNIILQNNTTNQIPQNNKANDQEVKNDEKITDEIPEKEVKQESGSNLINTHESTESAESERTELQTVKEIEKRTNSKLSDDDDEIPELITEENVNEIPEIITEEEIDEPEESVMEEPIKVLPEAVMEESVNEFLESISKESINQISDVIIEEDVENISRLEENNSTNLQPCNYKYVCECPSCAKVLDRLLKSVSFNQVLEKKQNYNDLSGVHSKSDIHTLSYQILNPTESTDIYAKWSKNDNSSVKDAWTQIKTSPNKTDAYTVTDESE